MANTRQCAMTPLQRQVLLYLREHPYLSYETIADSCSCSTSYVKKLASKYHMQRLRGLKIPRDVLEPALLNRNLYKDETEEASDVLTDPARLDELSYSDAISVCIAVASNGEAWQSTIDRLAEHKDSNVRRYSASSVSPVLLPKMARDPSPYVRLAVPYHPDCPDDIFMELIHDPSELVREPAARYLEHPTADKVHHLLEDPSKDVRVALTRNQNSDSVLLLKLFQDPHWQVKNYALSHENFPREIHRTIAHDPDPIVRASLARHTESLEIIDILMHDDNPEVLIELAYNEFVTGPQIETLMERSAELPRDKRITLHTAIAESMSTPPQLLHTLFRDNPHPRIMEGIAMNWQEADMSDLLHKIAIMHEGREDIEFAVVDNPNTAINTLIFLSRSEFEDIRYAAKLHLQARAKQPYATSGDLGGTDWIA